VILFHICHVNILFNVTTNKEVDEFFSFYNNYGFDLVPIARNDKRPIEQDWVNQNHKEIAEWKDWIKSGLNIGVKCGKVSNIVVIDCDGEIPELLKNCVTLSQKSNKGMHYFFEYDEEIGSSRIQDNLIDILSDGRQCVIFPSVIDDVKRVFKLGYNPERPAEWSEEQLRAFAHELRHISKPMIIAANKCDKPAASGNIDNLKKAYPELMIIPCSADSELALREASNAELIKYVPGEDKFEIEEGRLMRSKKRHLKL